MRQRFIIECEGAQHALELAGDDLRMLEHDVESEQILVAMGARTPCCIRAVDAWSNYVPSDEDPRHLIAVADLTLLSERGREQVRRQVEFAESHVEVMAKQRTRSSELWARKRQKALAVERFSAMLSLPEELRRRWLERYLREAERTWTSSPEGNDAPIDLLLMLACERSLASLGGREDRKLWWKPVAPGARPSLAGEAAHAPGVMMVGVPVRWLRERWLPGRDLQGGHVLLDDGILLDFDDAGQPLLRSG